MVASTSLPPTRPRWRERFRAKMFELAERRSALFLLCLLSFLDACCSPILPEVILIPMCLARPQRCYHYAFWCSAASVVGGVVGYGLGLFLWEHGLRELAFEHISGFTPAMFAQVSEWYGSQAFVWVWLAGFTPLPYKIFTVLAGVCHADVNFVVFVVASITSRFPRIYLEVWLLDRFGQPLLAAIMRRTSRFFLVLLLLTLAIVAWVQWG